MSFGQDSPSVQSVRENKEFLEVEANDGRMWVFHRHLQYPDFFYLPWTYLENGQLILGDIIDEKSYEIMSDYSEFPIIMLSKNCTKWYARDLQMPSDVPFDYFDTKHGAAWNWLTSADCCGTGGCSNGGSEQPESILRGMLQ